MKKYAVILAILIFGGCACYQWVGNNVVGWESDAKHITRECPVDLEGECFNMNKVAWWAKKRGINCRTVDIDNGNHRVLEVTEKDGAVSYVDSRAGVLFVVKAKHINEPYAKNQVGPNK